MSVLQINHLKKSFGGVQAVADLSLSIKQGTVTSIIGPNGSGKSTLVNLLTGLIPFDEGSVVISDVRLRRVVSSEIATYGVTRTFQDVRLFEQMTVLDNLLVVLTEREVFPALFERHKALHQKEAERCLRRVGLWEKRKYLASSCSYGQRKLLEIARALAMNPSVIFFDEPYAGLFPEMVSSVVGIMKELREHGVTQILIEHNMDIIRKLSDRVIVMDAGAVLAEGKPDDVLARKDVMEAYLGE